MKECKDCKQEKEDKDFFTTKTGNLRNSCKECHRKMVNEITLRKRKEKGMTYKDYLRQAGYKVEGKNSIYKTFKLM